MTVNIYKSIFLSLVLFSVVSCNSIPSDYSKVEKAPALYPDYTAITIPSNIAPLNFSVEEPGTKYCITFSSAKSKGFSILQKSNKVIIPQSKWKLLLEENIGNKISIDIYVYNNQWFKYQTIENTVAPEKIESHLCYRLINSVNILWREMGIYQRNLENYDEKTNILKPFNRSWLRELSSFQQSQSQRNDTSF